MPLTDEELTGLLFLWMMETVAFK